MSIVFAGLLLGACNNGVNSSESDTVAIDTCVEKTEEQLLEERSNRDITLLELRQSAIRKRSSKTCRKQAFLR